MARVRVGLAIVLVLCFWDGTGRAAAPAVVRIYAPSNDDLPNPERGFYRQFLPLGIGTARRPLDDAALAVVRQDGLTLVRAYFVVDEFAAAPLSGAVLDDIATSLAAVRRAGLKIIPRFSYNFPASTDYLRAQDAPLARVVAHIDQLAPLLVANADVIAFVEAGFVGAWGEWHTSSNGLIGPDRGVNSASSAILARLLSVVPSTRMVALRYPFHKQQLYGASPLERRDAFGGTPRARVGAHNDCFASGPSNGGTYSPPSALAQTIDALKAYLGLDNRFVPQGGESCGADGDANAFARPEIHCPSALADLARMRWSTMNIEYHPAVIDLWRQEGCLGEIRRRLGYRFRLIDATLPTRAVAGRPWAVTLRLTNDGWAAPYNPRLVELVLRHVSTGALVRVPLTADPRFWGPGEVQVLQVDGPVPEMPDDGDYELLLHLPDPERGLYDVPAYSVRLANIGVWEPVTGFNALQARVSVRRSVRDRRTECVETDDRLGKRPHCTDR